MTIQPFTRKTLYYGIFFFLLCVLLVSFAYWFIDKPVAFLMNHHTRTEGFSLLVFFTYLSKLLYILAVFTYLYYLIRYALKKCTYFDNAVLAVTNSVVIAAYIKDQLKFVFGRTWPETWINNNPSLIHNNVYGFNFFRGGPEFASFPSGHTTIIVAAMFTLWQLYPRYWPLYLLAIVLVITGLIGMDYHFVSDVIAGGFLGAFVSYCVVKIGFDPLQGSKPK